MKLVRFTRPDGSHIEINPEQVVSVRPAFSADNPKAKTVITDLGGMHAVCEDQDTVDAKLGE